MSKMTIYTEQDKQKDMSLDDIYHNLMRLGLSGLTINNGYGDKNIHLCFCVHGSQVFIKEPFENITEFKSTLNRLLEKRLRFER